MSPPMPARTAAMTYSVDEHLPDAHAREACGMLVVTDRVEQSTEARAPQPEDDEQ